MISLEDRVRIMEKRIQDVERIALRTMDMLEYHAQNQVSHVGLINEIRELVSKLNQRLDKL